MPAARKPSGAVTPPRSCFMMSDREMTEPVRSSWKHPCSGKPHLFGKSQHEIHRLKRLSCGALDEIIQCCHGDNPSSPLIDKDIEVAEVCAAHVPWVGGCVAFRKSDKPLSFIKVTVQGTKLLLLHRFLQSAVGRAQ